MPQSNSNKVEVQMNNADFFPHLVALLNEGHTVSLGLRGFSMRPFLEDKRDSALLAKATEVHIGDAVLAEIRPGVWVLHRLIDITDGTATLMGDGNLSTEKCREEDIKAKALGFYRKGRKSLDATDGRKWRCYSWIWTHLRPVRRYLLGIYRRWVKLFGPI